MFLPDIFVQKFEARVDQNIHLRKRIDTEGTTIDTCICLDGQIDSRFYGSAHRARLRRGMQNFIYQPTQSADHYITRQESVQVLHVQVDNGYYAGLLSDNEKWSAELKEKIIRRELIFGLSENTHMTAQMNCIVNDILTCQLTGSLRALILEAKILEFLALQLDQLVREQAPTRTERMKPADRDALVALHEYLQQTFTTDHSLRKLAKRFGLNEFKLKKGFKTLFNTTVFDYLHELKMNHARQLLVSTQTYVNEISGMVGYKNPNHFSTAFKRKFGVNPAQCRK
jgi:AraC-like DNA-binding protein